MKKIALALIAASALMFGFGTVAQAQYGTKSVTPTPASPAPGATVTLAITGCAPNEVLTVNLNGAVVGTGTCPLALTAAEVNTSITFPAPATPGTYPGTVTGNQGFSGTFQIVVQSTTTAVTVPGGGLPATGSDGTGTTTGIALGLLLMGGGLLAVTQVRRRQNPITA